MSLRSRIQRLEEWTGSTLDGALPTDEIRLLARALDIPEEGLLRIFREVIPTGHLTGDHVCFLVNAIWEEYPNASRDPERIEKYLTEHGESSGTPQHAVIPHRSEQKTDTDPDADATVG